MRIENLFGDYTIEESREIIREEYTKETGKKAEGTDYSTWLEDLFGSAASILYEERARESVKACMQSGIFRELFSREPLKSNKWKRKDKHGNWIEQKGSEDPPYRGIRKEK